MNWEQFKAALEAAGVTDETPIGYMDFSYPTVDEHDCTDLRIQTAPSGTVNVWN